ncbi:xylulokinase [Brooklawnia cerclae]|uniref:Xylulose kinase n=1 Tax=Brooklawnia cerclae TaxID=349934 RepID=A0ABX0SK87_9ACTN|nr:xylulokinase [Brooklawnia cerclae]
MTLVAGVDSSTQSCKVVVRDARDGRMVRHGSASHPDGTEVDPRYWLDALDRAIAAAGGLDDVAALSVAGQQHGMVVLDDRGEVIRPALLWNDTRSAQAAASLTDELGGKGPWVQATGSVPVASLTVSKLRWLADHEPGNARRVAAVALPHDWLTWHLRGGPSLGLEALTTDRSDASGTGYFDPATNRYERELLALALRRDEADGIVLPRVLSGAERAGTTPAGAVVGAGCGDNAGAALSLQMTPGDVSVSIGTSGVVAAISSTPVRDATGAINGFADATGNFLPLGVTLNAAQTLDVVRDLLGVGYEEFDALALGAPAGAGGLTLVPYYQGERTPNLPRATASLVGMTLAGLSRANLARAAVEGLLCSLADALRLFVSHGIPVASVRLIGGGARSRAVQRIAPAVFGMDVLVPEPGEYVADGAARQAAWALDGELPDWLGLGGGSVPRVTAEPTPQVLDAYRERAGLHADRPLL